MDDVIMDLEVKDQIEVLEGGANNEDESAVVCSHCATKDRDDKQIKDMINRLSRIEGQVRGIKNMVENDAYCVDILRQVSAVTSALSSFNKVLLADHIKTCVAEDIRAGNEEKIDELVVMLQKLMK